MSGVGARAGSVALGMLLALGLTLVPAAHASGQGAGQDTTKTEQERILEKLRAIRPLISQDSLPADSTDSSRVAAPGGPTARGVTSAAGQGSLPRDSIMNQLLEIPGYSATEYRSNRAIFRADSASLQLRDSAEVQRLGSTLTADSTITFWQRSALACANGNPVVSMPGGGAPISSDSLCYNTDSNVGNVRGFRTQVSDIGVGGGGEWLVVGEDGFLVRRDPITGEATERVYAHSALFTDCDLEVPHYHFAAKELLAVRGDLIVARSVTLNFGDVPVFWVPFFVQSLKRDRRSGLLTPRFGINDIARQSASYSRRIENIGFYWAISEYFGSEIALDWQSGNYTSLRGSLDYSFRRQFLRGALTFRRFWKAEGGQDFTLATSNGWQPDERTRLSLTGNYATSTAFIRERSYDPRELNRSIASNFGVNRRFDWGTLSVSGNRTQYLSDNAVQQTLPSVTANLNSRTLFPALPGEEKLFSNITWTANASARVNTRNISESMAALTQQDQRELTASASNSFRLGRLSLSQSANLTDRVVSERTFESDTIEDLPRVEGRTADWDVQLSYQQRLIATSTLSPRLSLKGSLVRDSLDGTMVAGPTRLNFGAGLNTAIFGFWPGFGPFAAIRHKITPTFSYTYSPAPNPDARQQRLFNTSAIRETNQISVSLSQTFEARYEAVDTAQADTLAVADTLSAPLDLAGEPRRRPRARVIRLLAINTDALAYDFVEAREGGDGFVTTRIGNNIQSDLVPGLQLRVEHDLFEMLDVVDPDDPTQVIDTKRNFAPRLSNLSASFSLSSESPLMRAIGLGRPTPEDEGLEEDTASVEFGRDAIESGEEALIGSRRRSTELAPSGSVGQWRASISYSLTRPRNGEENQLLRGTISMQPTELWSVQWQTGYNFTRGEFSDHVLTMTRRMHDFDANFDFYRAQNGNFAFQFRVELRSQPDLKLDYEQRDLPARSR